jgi:hypothetical protein
VGVVVEDVAGICNYSMRNQEAWLTQRRPLSTEIQEVRDKWTDRFDQSILRG